MLIRFPLGHIEGISCSLDDFKRKLDLCLSGSIPIFVFCSKNEFLDIVEYSSVRLSIPKKIMELRKENICSERFIYGFDQYDNYSDLISLSEEIDIRKNLGMHIFLLKKEHVTEDFACNFLRLPHLSSEDRFVDSIFSLYEFCKDNNIPFCKEKAKKVWSSEYIDKNGLIENYLKEEEFKMKSYSEALEEFEKEYFTKLKEIARNNSQAASIADISRNTLDKKVKKYES